MLAEKSAAMSERLDYVAGQLNAYRGIAAIGVRAGELETSLNYVDKGIALIERKQLPKIEIVNLLINKGSTYTYVDDLENAIAANAQAYNLAKENNFIEKEGIILNNMGIIYRKMNNYEMAIKTYNDGIQLRRVENDSVGLANTYFNIGAVYSKIDSAKLSYDNIELAKNIYQELGMETEVKDCDVALGCAAFDLGDFDQSYNLLHKIEQDPTYNPEIVYRYRIHIYLATLALEKNNTDEAARLLNNIPTIESSNSLEDKIDYYKLKSSINEKSRDYKNALFNKNKYIELQNEFNNIKTIEIRENLQEKFQSRIKDLEITKLEAEQTLSTSKLKAARLRNYGLGFGIIILGGFLWSLSKLNRKINKQNVIITKANNDKELLLKEIHHRVKNNLQVVSSLLNIQERKVNDQFTKDALKASKSRVQSISILHQNLYQGNDLKDIEIRSYINRLIQNIQNTYAIGDDIEIITEVDDIQLDVDILIPLGLIINELTTNSIKHAFDNKSEGKINILLKASEGFIRLQVKDNGRGVPDNKLPYRDGSIGTRLITSFAEKLNAEITVDNTNGTNINLSFKSEQTDLD